MNFRTIGELSKAIQQFSMVLPHDLSLVVGVPRSGMLAALLLALHRNVLVTDLDGFLEGRVMGTGARGVRVFENLRAGVGGTVLVLDDTASSGREMRRVQSRVRESGTLSGMTIKYGVVYVTYESIELVDYWYEVLHQPRVFEWNLLHSPTTLGKTCVDIDGVLCRDPSDAENDDGPRYQEFLQSVPPLVVPTVEIGWLVTCRLEKYRALTEDWLAAHKFQYRELIMLDVPDAMTRQSLGRYGKFKAEQYKLTGADLFVESSKTQAFEIAEFSGKPVYCVEHRRMISPGIMTETARQPKRLAAKVLTHMKQEAKHTLLQYGAGRSALRAYRKLMGLPPSR